MSNGEWVDVPKRELRHDRIKHISTPTGPVAVIAPVAKKLLAEGIISGSLDGDLHAADAATVKAAVMADGVCDFCSVPGATHIYEVPDFDMPAGGKSVGGWAACDECDGLIRADRRKDLLDRSVDALAFPKFSRGAIQEVQSKFWRGRDLMKDGVTMAGQLRKFINDELPDQYVMKVTDRDKRIQAILRATNLTEAELNTFLTTDDWRTTLPAHVVIKLEAWRSQWGTKDPALFADIINGTVSAHKPPAPQQVPHWQRALDEKFSLMAMLRKLTQAVSHIDHSQRSTDLADPQALLSSVKAAEIRRQMQELGVSMDLKCLAAAQVYSFNGETASAIQEAAASIPVDAPLSSIETPNTGAGWFWFGDPLAIAASPRASDRTSGLLWSWVNLPSVTFKAGSPTTVVEDALENGPQPALMFSAYVRDDKSATDHPGRLLPSTRWYWRFHQSFEEMLAHQMAEHTNLYGPGGRLESSSLMTHEEMESVIGELSRFFVMACVWFRQTVPGQPKKKADPVLTQAPGHIERHARKRLQREHKLSDPPAVTVVALRKSARMAAVDAPEERADGARNYQCRWIVKGHPRMQACGPGRKDRKLVWIEAHPAGPADKPLRTKTTVFAVVR